MKKIFIAAVMLVVMTNCKKEGNANKALNLWTGGYLPYLKGEQPYVIEFISDSTLKFYDYAGVLEVNYQFSASDSNILVDLPGTRPHFQARLTQDVFANIINLDPEAELQRGRRNTETDQKLTGTQYEGHLAEQGVHVRVTMKFTSENGCEINIDDAGYVPAKSFERNRGMIRFKFEYLGLTRSFFGVIEGPYIVATYQDGTIFLEKY